LHSAQKKNLSGHECQLYTFLISMNKKLALILLWFFFIIQPTLYSQDLPDLVFVQIPLTNQAISATKNNLSVLADRYVVGARIVKLSSSSAIPVNLTPEFYAACDPDISFDGSTIIFSGKKEREDYWQIWQMNAAGSQKLQITHCNGHCITPVFAGTRFYLDDPQPTPQIIYASTEHGWINYQETEQIFSLYGMDPTGETIHRLTFNLDSDYYPDVLPNGRIIFISWQNSETAELPDGHFALLAVNNDGTDLMPFYGNHEKPFYKDMVQISDFDDRVYFVESDSMVWLGGGDISFVSQWRPLHSYQKLSHSNQGFFHSPCPLPEGKLLASYRSKTPDSNFGIFLIDKNSGKLRKQVFNEQGWHSIDTQPLLKHPVAKGRSNWLIPGVKYGVFYCLNSYMTNLPEFKNLEAGTIKFVRVLEGIPRKKSSDPAGFVCEQNRATFDAVYSGSATTVSRILGVAPVEEDGSFHIKVPAETPLNFQLLDQNQLALHSQKSWSWVIGNENRGCIGCHEDRELSPPNILVKAVIKPAADLMIPSDQRRTVDFRHQIAPLIESKCATAFCHVPGQAKPNLMKISVDSTETSSRQIYETLLNTVPDRNNGRYIIPGNATESPLIWHLFGEYLGMSQTNYNGEINLIPSDLSLTNQERLLFIEWIDLGAVWDYEGLISAKEYE
jgi:hypothetical protein